MDRESALPLGKNEKDVPPDCLDFPVVGIGASAGGIQALVQLFEGMPRDSGMAFVVVVHLSPKHESHVDQILQRATRMPVVQVSATVPIEKGHVYVISPAMSLKMSDGHLQAVAGQSRDSPGVIDVFFRTLADAHASRAVAIVLSGTGADGSLGMARIKEQGGVNLVQIPKEAQFDGMPCSAIESNVVDFVLPVADMPQKLLDLWHNADRIELPKGEDSSVPAKAPANWRKAQEAEAALVEVLKLLSVSTGHDFKHYKRATVLRRIERRMQVNGVSDIPQYLARLRQKPDETKALLADMLIGITNFFRDREAFEALEREVMPAVFEQARGEGQKEIRVWTVACSTGEEAYSVAMVMADEALRRQSGARLQVFATDVDEQAIAEARRGVYPEAIVTDVPPAYLRQFFSKEANQYHIIKRIRDMVVFASHNILRDPPFSRLQLITCRNLLIYLDRRAQQQVLRLFHSVLNPGGYLFLGTSETVDAADKLFTTVDKKNRIYRAAPVARALPSPLIAMGKGITRTPPPHIPDRPLHDDKPATYSALHQFALEKYGPPTVLMDQSFRMVHVSQRAGQFLRHVSGEPSHSLLALIKPELRVDLQTAVLEAIETGRPVQSRRLPSKEAQREVKITVSPFTVEGTDEQLLLVVFEEFALSSIPPAEVPAGMSSDAIINRLEADNQALGKQLQHTIERFTRTTDELKTSNEEFQAINEELRSATEELETSKEELESINEELITVNDELKTKVEETSKINNDLQNLISSSDIATIFVDRNMRVKWFTPKAVTLFSLINEDRGRTLSDITHRLDYPTMIADAKESFSALRHIEHEVRSVDNHWYLAKILPYRTTEDRIEGAVLNFVDITARKVAEQRLHEGLERLRLVAESTKDYAIITMDEAGHITGWNLAAEVIFGYTASEVQGQSLDLIFTPEDRAEGIPARELKTAREYGHGQDERWHLRKDGSRFFCSGVIFPMIDGALRGYAKIARDLTEKRIEEEERELNLERSKANNLLKDEFLAIMSHELRHPLNLIELNMEFLSRTPELKGSHKAIKAIEAVHRSVRSQSQIIADLLDFSRVQTGKLKLERSLIRLAPSVRSIVEAVSAQALQEHITLRTKGLEEDGEDALIVDGDAMRIEQIVWNLLNNAVKFTPSGGTITVALARERNEARLDVTDTGIGIAADSLEKVFTMFGQIERQVGRRRQHGLGIGLALVDQLARAHGGRVSAASKGEGHGSTFSLWLPLADGADQEDSKESMQMSMKRLQGLRVLLVDDSEEILEMLGTLCEMEGVDVATALHGQAALDLLAEKDFDILISDIGMPAMDGYELLKRLRKSARNADIPAVALSGYGRSEKAAAAGFTEQLYKPVPMNELLDMLAALAEKKK